MINKGKGKLKWERDMPRDIEEKLEVMMMMMMTMMMMTMMLVKMELIMVEIIMLRHNHFAVI